MKKLTFKEVVSKLEELGISARNLARESYNDSLVKEHLGKSENVYEEGGEGEGDYREVVTYFPEHDVYIKVTGFYQSYEGTEWDDEFINCYPKQVMVTQYHKI